MEVKNKEIHINRGDRLLIEFTIENGEENYIFKEGDKIKFSIYKKMNEKPLLQKEIIPIVGSDSVDIDIPGTEMKIGEMKNISQDYWYEIELNGDTTLIGCDKSRGNKLILWPEGADYD